MMNTEARDIFDRITMKVPSELTKDDIAFLKARRDYLRPEQKQIYAEILKGTPEMSPDEKANFVKANGIAVAKAQREAEEKAKLDKKIKDSHKPE